MKIAYSHSMEFHFTPLAAVCQWAFSFLQGFFPAFLRSKTHITAWQAAIWQVGEAFRLPQNGTGNPSPTAARILNSEFRIEVSPAAMIQISARSAHLNSALRHYGIRHSFRPYFSPLYVLGSSLPHHSRILLRKNANGSAANAALPIFIQFVFYGSRP